MHRLRYIALGFLGLSLLSAAAAAGPSVYIKSVHPVELRSLNDCMGLAVAISNDTPFEVFIDIIRPGSSNVKIDAPASWEAKALEPPPSPVAASRSTGDIMLIDGPASDVLLRIEAGQSGILPIDLRDYFSEIDLNNPEISLTLKLSGRTVRQTSDGPVIELISATWKGSVTFPVVVKGTRIRM